VHKAFLYLGDVFHSNGDEGTAENLFIVALEGFTQMDVHCSRADCMLRLGDVMKKRRDMARAESLWMEARTLFKQSLQDKGVAEVDIRLCDLVQD
jgi:TolA-binding protein